MQHRPPAFLDGDVDGLVDDLHDVLHLLYVHLLLDVDQLEPELVGGEPVVLERHLQQVGMSAEHLGGVGSVPGQQVAVADWGRREPCYTEGSST